MRSRRVAIGLITALTVISVPGALIAQGGPSEPRVLEWIARYPDLAWLITDLRLNRIFSSPVFIALALALAVSTAVCAWERTTRARRLGGAAGKVSRPAVESLRSKPTLEIASQMDAEEASELLADALAASRLRVVRGPRVIGAHTAVWTLWASPVFHWSLVTVIVLAGFGALTGYSGLIGVPERGSRVDAASEYGRLERGPLALAHSGMTLSMVSMVESLSVDSVTFGPTPWIQLSRGGRTIAEGYVRPNAPLRYGAMLVHASDYGLSPVLALTPPDSSVTSTIALIVDFSKEASPGTSPAYFSVPQQDGVQVDGAIELLARDRAGQLPRLRPPAPRAVVTLSGGSLDETLTTQLSVGDEIALPDGSKLGLDSVGYYARLSVVNNWALYPLYLAFTIALVSVSVALLMPFRSVLAEVVPDGAGCTVRLRLPQGRTSAFFSEQVEERVRSRFEGELGSPTQG